jgi:hypothetical protein
MDGPAARRTPALRRTRAPAPPASDFSLGPDAGGVVGTGAVIVSARAARLCFRSNRRMPLACAPACERQRPPRLPAPCSPLLHSPWSGHLVAQGQMARVGERRSPRRGAPRLPNSGHPSLREDPKEDAPNLRGLAPRSSRAKAGRVSRRVFAEDSHSPGLAIRTPSWPDRSLRVRRDHHRPWPAQARMWWWAGRRSDPALHGIRTKANGAGVSSAGLREGSSKRPSLRRSLHLPAIRSAGNPDRRDRIRRRPITPPGPPA